MRRVYKRKCAQEYGKDCSVDRMGVMRRIPKFELAYIAGFFDGEGYVGFVRDFLRFELVQKYPEVLVWIQQRIGGRVYTKRQQDRTECGRLTLYGSQAAIVIRLLFPFLIVKRHKAYEATVQYYKTRKPLGYVWPPRRTRNRNPSRWTLDEADRLTNNLTIIGKWSGADPRVDDRFQPRGQNHPVPEGDE